MIYNWSYLGSEHLSKDQKNPLTKALKLTRKNYEHMFMFLKISKDVGEDIQIQEEQETEEKIQGFVNEP